MGTESAAGLAVTQAAVDAVVAANPDKVAAYAVGSAPALGFLLGQVMKMTGGHANAATVQSLLRTALDEDVRK